jgi:hypothetical protein
MGDTLMAFVEAGDIFATVFKVTEVDPSKDGVCVVLEVTSPEPVTGKVFVTIPTEKLKRLRAVVDTLTFTG